MRKLAILAVILLIIIVIVLTLAVTNYAGFRDSAYAGIEGTVLMPIHDWAVASWVLIGNLGFTYIAAATLGIGIGGGLFLVFIVYSLFWQKLVQQKILHKQAQKTLILTREEPRDIIVARNPEPIKTKLEEPKKEEVTIESTS